MKKVLSVMFRTFSFYIVILLYKAIPFLIAAAA